RESFDPNSSTRCGNGDGFCHLRFLASIAWIAPLSSLRSNHVIQTDRNHGGGNAGALCHRFDSGRSFRPKKTVRHPTARSQKEYWFPSSPVNTSKFRFDL